MMSRHSVFSIARIPFFRLAMLWHASQLPVALRRWHAQTCTNSSRPCGPFTHLSSKTLAYLDFLPPISISVKPYALITKGKQGGQIMIRPMGLYSGMDRWGEMRQRQTSRIHAEDTHMYCFLMLRQCMLDQVDGDNTKA